jgi:hypothetical protein
MRYDSLPSEFAELAGKVEYVVKRGHEEWSSSCPNCSGAPHPDGTPPDRFRMFLRSKVTMRPFGWCRSCGFKWHEGKFTGSRHQYTKEEQEAMERERREYEEARAKQVSQTILLLEQERIWERYHKQINDDPEAMAEFARRGITDSYWLDYWQLGYCPTKYIKASNSEDCFTSSTVTIPIFESKTCRVLNVRHRILHTPPEHKDEKYRPEIKGLPSALFLADYERPLTGPALLVEGEFKAMTTYLCANDANLHVIGLPSKSPDTELLKLLVNCEPIYICLDPDAYYVTDAQLARHQVVTAAERLAREFAGRARFLHPVGKIDDLILAHHVTQTDLRHMMNTARKIHYKDINREPVH